jgi:hypothetical protein
VAMLQAPIGLFFRTAQRPHYPTFVGFDGQNKHVYMKKVVSVSRSPSCVGGAEHLSGWGKGIFGGRVIFLSATHIAAPESGLMAALVDGASGSIGSVYYPMREDRRGRHHGSQSAICMAGLFPLSARPNRCFSNFTPLTRRQTGSSGPFVGVVAVGEIGSLGDEFWAHETNARPERPDGPDVKWGERARRARSQA